MSRDQRKGYYNRDRQRDWDRDRDRDRDRERDRDRDRPDYRSRPPLRKRSRSPPRSEGNKRRSRSPRKNDKDLLDENILSEISKLPEPSELWDNQFQENAFQPPPPNFQEGVTNPPYGTQPSFQPQPVYAGIYDDFPPVASVPQPPPPDIAGWNQMGLPPPPPAAAPPPAPFINNVEEQIKKEAAIESEMRHQKAALSKQREDYIKKANILKKELDTLKDQRNELRGDAKRSPSPDTKRFLKENTKLQLEIQNKLKTIYNVVDMLNGIIGEEVHEIHDSDDSAPEKGTKRKSRSPSAGNKFNYVYYDPEMHWCRVCNEFPPTAKDYLNHLHSAAHNKMAAAHMEAPWHSVTGVNDGFPSLPSAPTKRTPIKGLQFFVPSTAWYCKLCDQFIGDLHCASAHLKSVVHSKNYTNFVEQNPHWETDWMSDRQKAIETTRAKKGKTDEKPAQYASHTITFNKDGFHTKRKDSPPPPADDKKKKKDKDKKKKIKKKQSSSSSSSSSDSSSSDSEPVKKKKTNKNDKTLTQWMSNLQNRLNDSDRKLLDTLKSRMKKEKVEEEKRRTPERSPRHGARAAPQPARKTRERERERESARREARSRSRSRSRRAGSRRDRADTPPTDVKKPEIRKMPFIGKMPVYKHLTKNSKTEDQKKDEEKKKEEEEQSKKRREEMDAEIQKKVAEFKEKIAKAQLEREQVTQQVELPPPAIALPTQLGGAVQHTYLSQPPPTPALPPPTLAPPALAPPAMPPPALPKDFQEALDIIFPSDVKGELGQQDSLFGMPPGFPVPGMAGLFPGLPLLNPQMFGFDMTAPLFQHAPHAQHAPRHQLYDTHVPIVPHKQHNNRHNKPRQHNKQQDKQYQNQRPPVKPIPAKLKSQSASSSTPAAPAAPAAPPAPAPAPAPPPAPTSKENGDIAKKKEQMDDLAMLGIDATDVGAGI